MMIGPTEQSILRLQRGGQKDKTQRPFDLILEADSKRILAPESDRQIPY